MHSDQRLPFTSPPNNLCILRLSAIGDICHTLPVVRTIQKHWPQTKLTWIIGKTEHTLIKDISDINFIIYDKSQGLHAYRQIARQLKSHHFDALLHMQMSLRASLISLLVKTDTKLGFDRQRAKDLQWLFTNHQIEAIERQHVVDSLFGFSKSLGIADTELNWDIPVSDAAYATAAKSLPDNTNYIVISPCSSKPYRNWNINGYARIAEYITEKYDLHVCLTGGNSKIENDYANQIMAQAKTSKISNLVGKTSLKELLAVIDKALCVISPDSGPAHMATTVNTPVIGLYATTNPDRARPYLSKEWLVNRYPDAIKAKFNKPVSALPWGIRVKDPGTMDKISIEDVQKVLDSFMSRQR